MAKTTQTQRGGRTFSSPPTDRQGSAITPSVNDDAPSSPSKEMRKRRLPVRAILSGVLVVALVASQSIFWAIRHDALTWTSSPQRETTTTSASTKNAVLTVSSASHVTTAATTATTTTTVSSSNRTVYKFRKQLAKTPTTVVTAYFQLDSKFTSQKYDKWMKNMLSTQESMVIFTSKNLLSRMHKLRKHALDRTIVICMDLDNVPVAQQFPQSFWQLQVELNPERQAHKGYLLFWVWLSKSWFVNEAITGNWFASSIYMWSDIGCYRTPKYRNAQILKYPELIPRHSILQMAHRTPNPPSDILWNDKLRQRMKFYHSGSQAIGYKNTWREFHAQFDLTFRDYALHRKFVGEDQTIMQSTCIRNPNLCAYIPFDQVNDNHYFGLRYALHFGGNYTLWRPPGANVTSENISTVK
jgi:hypothetical protein